MYLKQYESARRNHGVTPVFFVSLGQNELEGSIRDVIRSGKIEPADYEKVASATGTTKQIQIHYVHSNGEIYRVFVGEGGQYRVIKIGDAPANAFPNLVPEEKGLTESQINRRVRRTLSELVQQNH